MGLSVGSISVTNLIVEWCTVITIIPSLLRTKTAEQAILISECTAKVGFDRGIVVDFLNSAKAKKHYLVLSFDHSYTALMGLTSVRFWRRAAL